MNDNVVTQDQQDQSILLQALLLERAQLGIERESQEEGIRRYRQMIEERGQTATAPGQTLLRRSVEPLAAAIAAYVEEVTGGKAKRGASVVAKYLAQFEPDLAAYITARYVINGVVARTSLQSLALSITSALEDTINHEALRKENPGLYKQLQRKIEKSRDERYRHLVLRAQMKFAKVETVEWTVKHKLQLGELLVHLMVTSTKLVELKQTSRKTPLFVAATEETVAWLEESHARCELLNPVFMPMVVQPRPWKGPFGGGYLTKALRQPLVKTGNRNYLQELRHWEMPKVYAAVNALQDTAWRINGAVLRVMREVWESGGTLGKLPPRDLLPLPAKTFAEDCAPDDEGLKAWKREAARVHEENARLVSKRVGMACKLQVAEKFAPYGAIHFVHALDWRGRAYAVGSYVHPQADDSGKALLEFAEGRPLGDNGAYWLAVHGANLFGVDKVSFEERVRWVQQHVSEILDSAMNPLDGGRFWAQADKPYQFLAFCFEWSGLEMFHTNGGDTAGYISNLPVAMDGTCNGLQNYAAMLRDEVGGAATNLVPADKPSDIYSEVSEVANAILEERMGGPIRDPLAEKWAGKVTRRMVKRNTMTVPYSVTEFGMRDQMMGELRKMKDEGELPVASYTFEDARMLAGVNYEAIGQVVTAARRAMEWLQKTAKAAAADGLPIRWVTPSGMLVVQDYREMVGKVFDSRISGRRVELTLRIEGTKLDKKRMASGISPNFIHSLDAAHMVGTVNRSVEAGVTHFAMIHDSFGTHAGSVDALAHALRAAFVEQYSGDVLGDFRRQVVEQLPEELALKVPPVPPFGRLEVSEVLNSDYFFA